MWSCVFYNIMCHITVIFTTERALPQMQRCHHCRHRCGHRNHQEGKRMYTILGLYIPEYKFIMQWTRNCFLWQRVHVNAMPTPCANIVHLHFKRCSIESYFFQKLKENTFSFSFFLTYISAVFSVNLYCTPA